MPMCAAPPPCLLEYIDGLQQHDIARIASTVADDVMFVSATRVLGKQSFLEMLSALYRGFPDWKYEYQDVEDRGQGNYAVRWRQSGTHSGTWAMPGVAPLKSTGKRVRMPPQYFFYRVADNKLTLIFPEPIIGGAPRGILEQIGITLPPL